MKKFLVTLIVVTCLCGVATAANQKSDKIDYKVTISITYNAVSADDAARIASEITKTHENACSCEVKISKNGEQISSYWTVWPQGTLLND